MKAYQRDILDFTNDVASNSPYPGGGGVAALVLALASALGNMVGSLTVGKAKYADVQDEILELNNISQQLTAQCLECIDADAESFKPLALAYRMDKLDPNREKAIQDGLLQAVSAPLELIDICQKVIDVIQQYSLKGSKLALSDAGCAASLAIAALDSAALNVYINTKAMNNETIKNKINKQVEDITKQCHIKAEGIYKDVESRLK